MEINLIDVANSATLALVNTVSVSHFNNHISIKENIRLIPPFHFRGVDIYVLDESSQMYTGSFKALTAVECINYCLQNGFKEICFTSGANTGMALAAYANKYYIKSHFFIPLKNLWKLNFCFLNSPLSAVYAVKDAAETKKACAEFSKKYNIPLMPKKLHRFNAAKKRGVIIASLIDKGYQVDWFAQTVCAGFGPIGIYDFLSSQKKNDHKFQMPRFLGIQQSANYSLTRYLQSENQKWGIVFDQSSTQPIEEAIYDQHPETYGTFPLMKDVIKMSNGVMITLSNNSTINKIIDVKAKHKIHKHLENHGINLTVVTRDKRGPEFVQKAGLLAIAGVMEAVNIGLIAQGQKILCSFSGGATAEPHSPIPDEYVFQLDKPYDVNFEEMVKCFRNRKV